MKLINCKTIKLWNYKTTNWKLWTKNWKTVKLFWTLAAGGPRRAAAAAASQLLLYHQPHSAKSCKTGNRETGNCETEHCKVQYHKIVKPEIVKPWNWNFKIFKISCVYKFFHIIEVKKTALKIKENIPANIIKYSIKRKQLWWNISSSFFKNKLIFLTLKIMSNFSQFNNQ